MPVNRSTARRALVRSLLEQRTVSSQEQLRKLLAGAGHAVTQTTVSRDLAAIGARRVDAAAGPRYAVRPRVVDALQTAAERMRLFVVTIEPAGQLLVIRTPPGSAHSVAVALDAAHPELPELAGTLAGDDTIFAAARPPHDGATLGARLNSIMESAP